MRHAADVVRVPGPRPSLRKSEWGSATGWVYGFALVWWASSFNLRNSVLMAWSPVEPIWVGSLAVLCCVLHRLGRELRVDRGVVGPFFLVVVAFVPGAMLSLFDGYGPTKTSMMLWSLLPVLAAALLLLDGPRPRAGWVGAQAVLGLLVALAAIEVTDPTALLSTGRLTLATVDTISTARFVGAAVVVLLVLGLVRPRTIWWAWPGALAAGAVVVQVGSRGPLLAVATATVVTVVAAPVLARRRVTQVLALLALAGTAVVYAAAAGGAGGRRIFDSVSGDLDDDTRQQLLRDAWDLSWARPWGVGWGDFAQVSPTAGSIANAQGAAYAHNVFAEVLVEGGVVALLAVVVLVVVSLVRARRAAVTPAAAIVLALIVYWLFNAQFSYDVVGNRVMWLMLVCGLLSRPTGPPVPSRTPRPGPARAAT